MKIFLKDEKYIRLEINDSKILNRRNSDKLIFDQNGKSILKSDISAQELYLPDVNIDLSPEFYKLLSKRNNTLASENPSFNDLTFKGILLHDDSLKNLDISCISVFKYLSSMLVINNHLKEIFDKFQFSGLKFFACYNKKFSYSNIPEYWLAMSSIQLSTEYLSEILNQSASNPNSIFSQIFKDNIFASEYDFLQSPIPTSFWDLSELYSYPNIISQNVYQVLKNFKGLSFYPINTVSRRLDLEDTIEIIK